MPNPTCILILFAGIAGLAAGDGPSTGIFGPADGHPAAADPVGHADQGGDWHPVAHPPLLGFSAGTVVERPMAWHRRMIEVCRPNL